MSIQRYDDYELQPSDDGAWVKYADHVAAVAEAVSFGYEQAFEDGAQAERARIRQAVEGIANDDYCYDYDCRMKAKFLSIIDGTADA